MDWLSIAVAWGPALPTLYIVWRAFKKLVYRTVTKEFREMRRLALLHERRAEQRHKAHMRAQKCLCNALTSGKACKHQKKTAPDARPGTRKRSRGSKVT